MQSCLNNQVFQILLVYLDDIIVFSKAHEEHLERLDRVLTRLAQHGFKSKPQKCTFLRHRVSYLKHVVSVEGVETDPEKVSAVSEGMGEATKVERTPFVLGLLFVLPPLCEGFHKDCWPAARATEPMLT